MRSKIFLISVMTAGALAASPAHAKKPPLVTLDEVGLPPSDIPAGVRAVAQTYLKDPDSATYQIGSRYPGFCKEGWLKGNGIAWKGWAVNVMINARNSFGGYAGYSPFTVLFVGDNAIRIMEGENFGAYGPSTGMLGLGGGAGVCQIIKE